MVALIFVREVSDPLTSLVKKIDQKVNEASGKYAGVKQLGTYVIIGDGDGRAEQLRGMAKKAGLQRVSLCIGTAPPRYEVNKEADVTVVIYNPGRRSQQQVMVNFALRKGDLDEAKANAIVKSLAEVLPK